MTTVAADKRIKCKWTPGIGGMRCACCTQGKPSRVKKGLSRTLRRMSKLALRNEI